MGRNSLLGKNGPSGSSKDSKDNCEKNGDSRQCAFQDLDHSVLQHSLTLGVTNVKQILNCVQNGSKEIKDLLLNECTIIYECKVCSNLFRSLANFLYHKRCYCKKHLCEDMLLFDHFEEQSQIVTVQPEPVEKSPTNVTSDVVMPKVMECSVDLSKSTISSKNLVDGRELPKEKVTRGKNNKSKEIEIDVKKTSKVVKSLELPSVSPMMSRRTREKNRLAMENALVKESLRRPTRFVKSTEEKKTAPKEDNKPSISKVNEDRRDDLKQEEEKKMASSKIVGEKKGNVRKANMPKKWCGIKPSEEEKLQNNKLGDVKKGNAKKVNDESAQLTSNVNNNSDQNEENEMEYEKIHDKKLLKCPNASEEPAQKRLKTLNRSSLTNEDEGLEIVNNKEETIQQVNDSEKLLNKLELKTPSKEMFLKPLQKIIVSRSNTGEIKSTSIFDSIQKDIKGKKIGFTKIADSDGKKLKTFPKIIFKTIDGNPHAVFQTTDITKMGNINFKGNVERSVGKTKTEKDKLIIVLKKEAASAETSDKLDATKNEKSHIQTDFHLTRRKKLLARSDCNIHNLKCLTCDALFTSLKTLYFHMLSIHSKKRLYYPCPFCKTLFVQMYGVTRHVMKIHNKTKEQINKIRDQIKKKSIWKKVNDVNMPEEEIHIEKTEEKADEIKNENASKDSKTADNVLNTSTSEDTEMAKNVNDISDTEVKTVIKLEKNAILHQCSKCSRVFGRKSSQVSHEKFCIMNAIKVETVDLSGSAPISPPPNVSFLASPTKTVADEFHYDKYLEQIPSDIKVNARPKRGAEKQMHKDFVNSQTLKWRSVNRAETNLKPSGTVKKLISKNIANKIQNMMNIEKLLCLKCSKTFSSFSNLRRHVAIHVGWTRFKCKFCDYQAYNKSQCWAHILKAHPVNDEDVENSVVNLSNSHGSKKLTTGKSLLQTIKQAPAVKTKSPSTKESDFPKDKVSRKKVLKSIAENKPLKSNKVPVDIKRNEVRKDKNSSLITRKNSTEMVKNTIPKLIIDNEEESNQANIEAGNKVQNQKSDETKRQVIHTKPVRRPSFSSIMKYDSSDEDKERCSNYKTLTTNSPTTIILSKKFSIPPSKSILAFHPESVSSNSSKTFQLRSSVRKRDSEPDNGKGRLITRSTTYSKNGGPTTITFPNQTSMDNSKNQVEPDKVNKPLYGENGKLIGRWIPKMGMNSQTRTRESAPLIIGLVPASGQVTKSPVISYERRNS